LKTFNPKKMKLSKYKGVTWNRRADKYVAYVRVNGKQVTLGYFNSEEEANDMVQKHSKNNPKQLKITK